MNKYEILKQLFGYSDFRGGQEILVDGLSMGCDVIGVMPTGTGKSLCYQIPALMSGGITIVISPLISLMKDQVNSLTKHGVNAAYINSSLTSKQYNQTMRNAELGMYKIIYIAPERLTNGRFIDFAKSIYISYIAIDEAHCVSHWGYDFRPSYLEINEFIEKLPDRPTIGAFTATATEKVRKDIIDILRLDNPLIVSTGFDRPNLYFSVFCNENKDKKLIEITKNKNYQSGIIYCTTRNNVEHVCALLNENGIPSAKYHAGLKSEERSKNQDEFLSGKKQVIIATNSFGMGINKSDVRFVLHYNIPQSLEGYYQEAGRAGRDGKRAECILLFNWEDVKICDYFIQSGAKKIRNEELSKIYRQREEESLNRMILYCVSGDCLRSYMLGYFGEEYDNDFCDNCSSCLSRDKTTDITVEVQKILSCIIRSEQQFEEKTIIEVLKGKSSRRVRKLQLNTIPTFGEMKDYSSSKIRKIIKELVNLGLINEFGEKNTILKVSNISYPVIKDKVKIRIKNQRGIKVKRND